MTNTKMSISALAALLIIIMSIVSGVAGYLIGSSKSSTMTQTYVYTSIISNTIEVPTTITVPTTIPTTLSLPPSTVIIPYTTTISSVMPTTVFTTTTTISTITMRSTITVTVTGQPMTIPTGDRLFPFYFPWNDAMQTDISLATYIDKPAGKYGPVTVGSDGHLYVGGKRIRFLGVSVVATGAFPSKEEADIIAARLAKYGINLVRFHAIDANWEPNNNIFSPPGTRQLNLKNLDRMDYFIAALKRNGIYIDLNLMCYRQFSSADGLPSEVNTMQVKDQHLLPFFYDPARQLVKEFARQLLTHVNPYTGLSYADDPAVAFIEILNEYGMTFGWFDGAVDRLPQVFRNALREKWNEFLISKYGTTENLAKAWGKSLLPGESLENKTVDVFNYADIMIKRPTLQARLDWAEFLWQLDYDYFMDMYSFLKNELKVKAVVIGTQSAWGGLPNVMARLDAVDSHHYWRYPEGSGSIWYVVNDPMVNNPTFNTMSQLAFRSVYGKPFTVSEYNHPAPNMYRAEGFAFLPAFAAFQDWDAIMPYNYGPWTSRQMALASWNSGRMRGTLDFDQDPVRWALMLTSYFLFVRGDVSPAKQLVVAEMTKSKELDLVANRVVSVWNLPNAGQLNVPYYVPLIHGFRMIVDNTTLPTDALSPEDVAPPTDNVIRSDTGELVWDCSIPNRCVFIVNTSKSIVLTGYVSGRRFDFGAVSIEVGDTLLDGWATIALHVLDGNSFQDAKRILVIAIGTGFNNNMPIYNYDNRQLLFRTSTNLTKDQLASLYRMRISTFDNWGSAPTIVEGIEANITIKTNKNVICWALDNIGEKAGTLSPIRSGDQWNIKILPTYRTLLYEILVY
ncbi:MAG: beta-galactosidase [Ignisphaera sp.]